MAPKNYKLPASATETTPLLATSASAAFTATKDGLELSEEDCIDIATGAHYHTLSEDIIDTIKLGVPIFIAMLSWVGVSQWVRLTFKNFVASSVCGITKENLAIVSCRLILSV